METFRLFGLFAIALAVLLVSAKYFTDAAERIGIHFKIPPFIIGVTIVALGTSLPEVATSIIAVLQGHSEIVIGNVAGSNIANILLVLAITAIVAGQMKVDKDIINIDLPILMASVVFVFITTLDGQFTYVDGSICLIALITYIVYNLRSHRGMADKEMKELSKKKKEIAKKPFPMIHLVSLFISGFFLYFGADFTIDSVVQLAGIFNIGTEIIAISAVAIGTSLPELVVSVMAASKGKADLAIGNVTGSNIFNSLGVMGVPSFFGTLTIPDNFLSFTIPAMILITVLYIFITMDKQVTKWEGMTLLLLYVAFVGKTFGVV